MTEEHLEAKGTGEGSEVDKRLVLFTIAVGAFLTPFMLSSLNIALPHIGREFSLSPVGLGWMQTSYLLAAAIFLVPLGKVADRHGRKKVYLTGMALIGATSLLAAFAPGAAWLFAARVLQGIGAAMIFGTGVAILTDVFGPGERGRALGINVAAVYLGLSVGPVFGGFLTDRLGWRSIFVVCVLLAVVVVGLVLARLHGEWLGTQEAGFDYLGSVAYAGALGTFMWGLSRLPDVSGAGLVALGVALFAAFVWWETRAAWPVLDLGLFLRNRMFALSNLAALINYSATFAVAFLLSLYLQYIKGLGAETAGLILVARPALQMVVSPYAGRLSDRVEPRLVASAGMGLTVVGLVLLIFVDADTSFMYLVAALAVLGLGFGLFSSPNTNTIMSSVDAGSYGVASAARATMRLTGQMLSIGLATLIFAVLIGNVQITPDVHSEFVSSVQIAFAIFSVLCVAGLFASLARGNLYGDSSATVPAAARDIGSAD